MSLKFIASSKLLLVVPPLWSASDGSGVEPVAGSARDREESWPGWWGWDDIPAIE